MRSLSYLLISLLVVMCSALVSVWVMICGWGLSPRSWPVIIGGVVATWFLLFVQAAAQEALK